MSGLSSNNDLTSSLDAKDLSTGRDSEGGQTVVLVVDDSNTVLQSASNYLTEIGLSVVTANDGFEALAKVVDTRPAMLFVDIMMPRLDGYQTCALIKNNADFRDTPVVMLSSKDGLFDQARGRVAGADDHLSKPFNVGQITAVVEKHLNITSNTNAGRKTDVTISS